MKITQSYSFIKIVGTIWMPSTTAAMCKDLTSFDIENIIEDNTITREDVAQWLTSHSGDFSNVIDFYADIELPDGRNIIIDWENEDNECIYSDCMYGIEED